MGAVTVLVPALEVAKEKGVCDDVNPKEKVLGAGGAAAGARVDTACGREAAEACPNVDALGVVSPPAADELPNEKGVWVLLVPKENVLEAFGVVASDDEGGEVEVALISSPGFPKSVEGLGVGSAGGSRFQFDAMMPSKAFGVKPLPKMDPSIEGICCASHSMVTRGDEALPSDEGAATAGTTVPACCCSLSMKGETGTPKVV